LRLSARRFSRDATHEASQGRAIMAKNCERHGEHEKRKCPACSWTIANPNLVKFTTGCPRCGQPLSSNGYIMWCDEDNCQMQTTSHPVVR
jgi:uncharacterized paraquat-inducible protein A